MRTFTIASLVALSLLACGGSEASSPSPDAGAPTSDDPGAFCAQLFGSGLSVVDRCCAAQNDPDAKSLRDYLGQLKDGCDRLYTTAIAKGRLVATDARAGCFAAAQDKIKNAACTGWKEAVSVPVAVRSELVATCAKAYAGTGDVGAPCALPDECKDGLSCAGYVVATETRPAIDGRCVQPAARDQPCGAGPDDAGLSFNLDPFFGAHPACVAGAVCGGKCYPRVAEGQPCGSDDECIEGTRCLFGVCSRGELAGLGAPCKHADDCAFPLDCAESGTCAPLRGAGEACTSSKQCEGTCTGGQCASYCGSK